MSRPAGQEPALALLVRWRAFCRFAAAAQVRRRRFREPRPLVARSPQLGSDVVRSLCRAGGLNVLQYATHAGKNVVYLGARVRTRCCAVARLRSPVNGQKQGEAAMENSRRDVMAGACAVAAMTFSPAALAAWEPSQRYPDPAIQSSRSVLQQIPDRACGRRAARERLPFQRGCGLFRRCALSAVERHSQ